MAIYGQFSCDMPTELLKKGVGWQDRAVYAEAALYCRKELTDGVIDRVLLSMWMIDMPADERSERLDRMVKLKALRKHRRGWCFPPHVWSAWGVMKADVEAKRAAEAQRKADYRAKLSQRDKKGTGLDARVTATTCPRQPEEETEPETETKEEKDPSSSSLSTHLALVPTVDKPDDDDFKAVIDRIVDTRCAGRKFDKSERGYRATVDAEARQLDGELIRRMLADGDPPDQVALFVLGQGFATEAQKQSIPWCGSDCEACEGTGFVEADDGWTQCPNRIEATA